MHRVFLSEHIITHELKTNIISYDYFFNDLGVENMYRKRIISILKINYT